MSHGLQLDLPDNLYEYLERKAAETGKPLADVAVGWLASAAARDRDPLRKLFGTLRTELPLAEQHDDYLGAELPNEHNPRAEDHGE
jgi:hypothetical protein